MAPAVGADAVALSAAAAGRSADILDGTNSHFQREYGALEARFAGAQLKSNFLAAAPRFVE